eukprot:2716437-Karenia_brevis.AAC.1
MDQTRKKLWEQGAFCPGWKWNDQNANVDLAFTRNAYSKFVSDGREQWSIAIYTDGSAPNNFVNQS